jgi:dTDP-4-dehydrorhamnose 3,5-epimerase
MEREPGDLTLSVVGTPDPQLVRSDWTPTGSVEIVGVATKSITNVLLNNGALTELWRSDWHLDGVGVDQVFQRVINPGATSAWHVHLRTTDRLSCALGQLLVVLFDARVDSPSHGELVEYRMGERRPATISIPPGVYHGVRNIGITPAVLINAVDLAYGYDAPDHHRVPADTTDIPYRW